MLPVLLLATIPAQAAPLLASPQPSPRAADTTDPGEFQRVHLAGAVALDLFSQEAHRSAKIDCPTSQGAGLQLQVSGDTLQVTPQHESQRSSETCKLTLRVPSLHAIAVSGAATVRGGALTGLAEVTVSGTAALDLRGIQSESFALQVSGDGRARLSGKVDQLSIQSSGTPWSWPISPPGDRSVRRRSPTCRLECGKPTKPMGLRCGPSPLGRTPPAYAPT